MAENLLTVDVVDISIPPLSTKLIPFIEEPNPVTGYSANGDQIEGLLHFANCIITVSGTDTRVTGNRSVNTYYMPQSQFTTYDGLIQLNDEAFYTDGSIAIKDE